MSKYTIKDNIDKLIYVTYNLFADFIFLFKLKEKRLIKQNVKCKDIHKGERCFILGTGPSLNDLTLNQVEQLKQETTFGVNSTYKVSALDDVYPTYYSLFDNLYWTDWSYTYQEIVEKYKNRAPVFLTDCRAEGILHNLNLDCKSLFLYSKKYPINSVNDDISKNLNIVINVVSVTILIAIYMGFKEIYLLGCDYNSFAHQQEVHCYDDKDEIIQIENRLGHLLKFYALTTEFHYLIAKLAKRKGVKIVNTTSKSLLDAYPREDLSSLF